MATYKMRTCQHPWRSVLVFGIRIPKCPSPGNVEKYNHSVHPPKCGFSLPTGKPLTFKIDEPLPSKFVMEALISNGLQAEVDYTLAETVRSWITPEFVWQKICEYSEPTATRNESELLKIVYNDLRQELDTERKIPIYDMKAAFQMCPQDKSSGLPWLRKKRFKIFESDEDLLLNYWKRIGEGKPNEVMEDAASFARSHIISPGDENKISLSLKFPIKQTLGESAFAMPLIEEFQSQRIGLHTSFGMEIAKGGMDWLYTQLEACKASDRGCKIFIPDFSAEGETIPAWLISDIFGIFQEKLDFSKCIDPRSQIIYSVDHEYVKRQYDKVVDYFINTPIRNIDGRRYRKEHGIPSGSLFTDIIRMCVNFVISRYLCRQLFGLRPILDLYSVEDCLIVVPGTVTINISSFCKEAKEIFGLTVNPNLSYWTTDISNVRFLGFYCFFGKPANPTKNFLSLLLYPQFMKDNCFDFKIAVFCLAASAGCDTVICKAVRALSKYGLRFRHCSFQSSIKSLRTSHKFRHNLRSLGYDDHEAVLEHFLDEDKILPASDSCTKARLELLLIDLSSLQWWGK